MRHLHESESNSVVMQASRLGDNKRRALCFDYAWMAPPGPKFVKIRALLKRINETLALIDPAPEGQSTGAIKNMVQELADLAGESNPDVSPDSVAEKVKILYATMHFPDAPKRSVFAPSLSSDATLSTVVMACCQKMDLGEDPVEVTLTSGPPHNHVLKDSLKIADLNIPGVTVCIKLDDGQIIEVRIEFKVTDTSPHENESLMYGN